MRDARGMRTRDPKGKAVFSTALELSLMIFSHGYISRVHGVRLYQCSHISLMSHVSTLSLKTQSLNLKCAPPAHRPPSQLRYSIIHVSPPKEFFTRCIKMCEREAPPEGRAKGMESGGLADFAPFSPTASPTRVLGASRFCYLFSHGNSHGSLGGLPILLSFLPRQPRSLCCHC